MKAIELRQAWPSPAAPRPIVIIGAGAIVRTAHLPAYIRLKFRVAGLFDICHEAAEQTSRQFGGLAVYRSFSDAVREDVVFDVAVPGREIAGVLEQLPRGAAVLIQKPMGESLAGATEILEICRDRGLVAAMNFQLRFSPNIMAIADLVGRGRLGEITDIEVRVVDRQPWEQWTFLKGAPRLEVLYHSIHYLDTIRWLAGEPHGVMCRAIAHPQLTEFRDTRSSIVLDYGERIRCALVLNHTHRQDERHRESMIKIEGTAGAAIATLGVNLEYPSGPPDRLEVVCNDGSSLDAARFGAGWQVVPLRGSWFPEAFEGPMSNLQRFVSGEDATLVSPVADAIKTMALVEACYTSSAGPSTPIPAVGEPQASPPAQKCP
jgi:predicted dehydrogenase